MSQVQAPDSVGSSELKPLVTKPAFMAALGGVSERMFEAMRSKGLIDPPLELGPRMARWTLADVESTIARLPRRSAAAEPQTLAAGKRAWIDRMKSTGDAR